MWLRLTTKSGQSVLVNMTRVNEVYPVSGEDPTKAKLYFGIGEDDDPTEVRETLDEIEAQIREVGR